MGDLELPSLLLVTESVQIIEANLLIFSFSLYFSPANPFQRQFYYLTRSVNESATETPSCDFILVVIESLIVLSSLL